MADTGTAVAAPGADDGCDIPGAFAVRLAAGDRS